MEMWIYGVIAALSAAVIILAGKLFVLRHSVREAAEELGEQGEPERCHLADEGFVGEIIVELANHYSEDDRLGQDGHLQHHLTG